MCTEPRYAIRQSQAGISLVEVVVFILVMGIGVVGLLNLMNRTVLHSADPLLQKQALAVAESLLEEVMLQPFTLCDPAAYDPATGTCAQAEGAGPETIDGTPQSRYSPTTPFNNVNDYHGFAMNDGIYAISDGATVIAGLEKYTANVTVTEVGGDFGLAAGEAVRVNVRVTNPAGEEVALSGYRFRYASTP